jgi:hypothetical protein
VPPPQEASYSLTSILVSKFMTTCERRSRSTAMCGVLQHSVQCVMRCHALGYQGPTPCCRFIRQKGCLVLHLMCEALRRCQGVVSVPPLRGAADSFVCCHAAHSPGRCVVDMGPRIIGRVQLKLAAHVRHDLFNPRKTSTQCRSKRIRLSQHETHETHVYSLRTQELRDIITEACGQLIKNACAGRASKILLVRCACMALP